MGASLWDQVGLPLLIGLAIQIVATALCFLGVRLWKCFIKQLRVGLREQLTPQTAVEESAHDQRLPDGDAAAHAHGVLDLEMGNGCGRVEGGESLSEPESELGIVNVSEGIEHCSDQEARPRVIESPLTTPKTQVTRDGARGAFVQLVEIEMGVPHNSQHEGEAAE